MASIPSQRTPLAGARKWRYGKQPAALMKIYVSSTYQDLIEHRTAVDRTLRRMGHDVIGMEQYAADGAKPVDRCAADVRQADLYVLLVAWRYVWRFCWIPSGRGR